jgi:hypothetical protein
VRTGIAPLALMETDLPILHEMVRILIADQG